MKARLPILAAPLALGALLLLTGCNNRAIALCPQAVILADTANEPVFRTGAPHDLSGVAYAASITKVGSSCTFDSKVGDTVSTLDIDFRATRSPSADPASVTLDWFITINSAERVLKKSMQTVRFDFVPGSAVATAHLEPDAVILELERGHLPNDYQLLLGFQLTQEQLAFNRTMGRYVP